MLKSLNFSNPTITMYSMLGNIMNALIIGIIIVCVIRRLMAWKKNNDSPVASVNAIVLEKRKYRHSCRSLNFTYCVTFELAGGEHMALRMHREKYGVIAEGDIGELTFKGTRYIGFKNKFNGGSRITNAMDYEEL